MFSERFKNAGKNIKVSDDILQDTRKKMLDASAPHVKRRHYAARTAISFVCAAALAFGVWGTQLYAPPKEQGKQQAGKNLFSITAFAYEQQEDGQLKQKEIKLSQEEAYTSETIIAIRDGEKDEYKVTQIKMLGLKCQGENIEKVDFKIDNGVLKVPNESWAKEKLLKNLEARGNTLTVDYETGVPDEVYWESDPFIVKTNATYSKNTETKDSMLIPDMTATITATVYFKDGSRAEKSIVYNNEKGTIKVEET